MSDWLEYFWGEILSREPERTRTAFESLDAPEQRAAIIQHLNNMATEDGWAESQRISAQCALDALAPFIED